MTRGSTDPKPPGDVAAEVRHVTGMRLPKAALPSTAGGVVGLHALGARVVVFAHPMIGRPDAAPLPGWDDVPGARGCTAEACGFRDHHGAFQAAGVAVYGLSGQCPESQREAADRLGVTFPLLSDPRLDVAELLGLPTFELHGLRFYRRLTLFVEHSIIRHAFFPVEQPLGHADEVLGWLTAHPT